MSLRAAREGEVRSRQIMVALFLDTFQIGEKAQETPCPAIGVCTLDILCPKPKTLLRGDEHIARVAELRRLYRSYPELILCCLDFLASPRTEEQRARISAIKDARGCSCNAEHGTLLAAMHESADNNLSKNNVGGLSLGQLLIDSMVCPLALIHDVVSGKRGIFRVARAPRWKRDSLMWPRHPGDLYPYGMHETLVNMAAWIKHAPLPSLLTLVETMHAILAYPSLITLRLSITRDALISLFDHAMSCYAEQDSWIQVLYALPSASTSVESILALSKTCFVGVLSDNDITAWTNLVELMCSICVLVDELLDLPSGIPPSDLQHCSYRLRLCALRLAMIPGITLPAENFISLQMYSKDLNTISMGLDRFSGLFYYVRALHPSNNKIMRDMNIVCANPACDATKLSEGGQNIPICSGCSAVSYCSRVCQKAAWKHAFHPHKEVCKGLHILTQRMMNLTGAHSDWPRVWEICSGGGLDEPLAAKLGQYMAGIYGPR